MTLFRKRKPIPKNKTDAESNILSISMSREYKIIKNSEGLLCQRLDYLELIFSLCFKYPVELKYKFYLASNIIGIKH